MIDLDPTSHINIYIYTTLKVINTAAFRLNAEIPVVIFNPRMFKLFRLTRISKG